MSVRWLVDYSKVLFCSHEWLRRHERRRWRLECGKCGKLTPGFEIGHVVEPPDDPGPNSLALLPMPGRAPRVLDIC
jgi:hypothetical protein